jgi:demethylmenaquinone methyltransferase/2-methoxy-6-polyprenyl-1,4-benzoquinol methylase
VTDISTKEQIVESMFNGIAPKYDFLNHVLSFGIDKLWRKRLINDLLRNNPAKVLDVATGTADLAIALVRRQTEMQVVGVDIAENMLSFGRLKLEKKKLSKNIELIKASSQGLPFEDDSFDASMVAFGVRNYEDPVKGLREMQRVTKPGGTIHVLEFATPRAKIIRVVYRFYFLRILPWIGRKISGHKTACSYLPSSVEAFKERNDFLELLEQAGYVNSSFKLQSFGIAAIYKAFKPNL